MLTFFRKTFIILGDLLFKISGSSNLPPDKLTTLSASINKLLQLIVDIYNACEDANMPQEQKFNKISDTRKMDKGKCSEKTWDLRVKFFPLSISVKFGVIIVVFIEAE